MQVDRDRSRSDLSDLAKFQIDWRRPAEDRTAALTRERDSSTSSTTPTAVAAPGRAGRVHIQRRAIERLLDGCVTLRSGGSLTGVSDVGDGSVSAARREHAVASGRDGPACADGQLPPDAAPLQGLGTARRAAFWRHRPGRAGGGGLSRADRHRRPQRRHADARLSDRRAYRKAKTLTPARTAI